MADKVEWKVTNVAAMLRKKANIKLVVSLFSYSLLMFSGESGSFLMDSSEYLNKASALKHWEHTYFQCRWAKTSISKVNSALILAMNLELLNKSLIHLLCIVQ